MARRALAQSMARELGPRGVHVSHVVVDGAVDNPNTRKFFSDKHPEMAKMFDEKYKVDGLIQPASVAELYLQIHNQVQSGGSFSPHLSILVNQDRTVWTHEVDIRPWVEHF